MCVDWIDLKEIYCTCQTGRYPSNLDQTKGILLLFFLSFFFSRKMRLQRTRDNGRSMR